MHGRLLETLGSAITAGEYPPGSVLRTDELAQTFEVSRSVMREAVRVLESLHLVESRRRVGVIVRTPAERNVYDPQVIRRRLAGADRTRRLRSLTVLRSAVEPIAAGLAARHATAEQCAELTECAVGMVANSRGHRLEGYLHHDVMFDDPDPAAVTLHAQVAIREHDAPRAERLTREITVGALQELDTLAPDGHSPTAD
ncbi:GntR family transcriptional regulator [Streptomyces sp. TG1A-60]|uniref:FadR/GntR family transcriptional regulator n=1 Tax=Streptomyces sp. TG1A-60 TaxID=3129111 RepID=UPI0030CF4330